MSYIGNHRVRSHYLNAHVQDIRKEYLRLGRLRYADTNRRLSWNDRLFGQVHKFNFMHSKKEHCGAIYWNLIGHICRCHSIDCINTRPTGGQPHRELTRQFDRLENQYNSDPANEGHEMISLPRTILNQRTGEEGVIFVLGIIDNQRDIDNALEMLSYPMQGMIDKFDRILEIRDNLAQHRRRINRRQAMIDAAIT